MTLPRYVALGDSTGAGVGARHGGYPDRLARRAAAAGVPVALENLAVSGAQVADVLGGQLGPALAARPALATLGIGINDVTHGTDPARFARDYDRVAAALAGTGALVLAVNVLDLSRSPVIPGDDLRRAVRGRILAVNAGIAEAAARHRLGLVDLFAWTADLEFHPELLSADRFHPSDAGYERWTDVMEGAFLGAVRALHGGAASAPPAP
jgi:lysophospholipase L1-like esterase